MSAPPQTSHSLAEQWASTQQDMRRAEELARRAKDDVDRLRARLTTLSEALAKRVGQNVPTKVFAVSADQVVIVDHASGVRLVDVTAKDAI